MTSTARKYPVAPVESPLANAVEPSREPHHASMRGRLLQNRYLPETLLCAGPFGSRYLGDDLSRNETVCVELLPRRALGSWGELCAAAERLRALGDPNIASPLGQGVAAGIWPFWVTEHGPTLRDELALAGPLELSRVARIGARCASALAAAHRVGVLHGALAPDRVLLGAPNALGLVRITGLGLAPLVQANGDALFGCPPELFHYVSPEHERGERLEARSDVYSLGAILYELAVGAPPFTGNATAVLRQHRRAEAELPSRRLGTSCVAFRAFDKIVARCLAKHPEQRYPGAAELALDLARLDAALSRLAGATNAPDPDERPSGPRLAVLPSRRSAVEVSPARRPPKARGCLPAMPKVIVRG